MGSLLPCGQLLLTSRIFAYLANTRASPRDGRKCVTSTRFADRCRSRRTYHMLNNQTKERENRLLDNRLYLRRLGKDRKERIEVSSKSIFGLSSLTVNLATFLVPTNKKFFRTDGRTRSHSRRGWYVGDVILTSNLIFPDLIPLCLLPGKLLSPRVIIPPSPNIISYRSHTRPGLG